MPRSRSFPVLLLLACSVTAVHTKEPGSVIGAGASVTCKGYIDMLKDHNYVRITDMVISWVQGYFSARNTVGRTSALTVGGSISNKTLEAMLVDQCSEQPYLSQPVYFAAIDLYDKLEQKGL
jgi:hypothetical protein